MQSYTIPPSVQRLKEYSFILFHNWHRILECVFGQKKDWIKLTFCSINTTKKAIFRRIGMGWDWISLGEFLKAICHTWEYVFSVSVLMAPAWHLVRHGLLVDNNQSPVWLNPYFQAWLGLTPDNGSRAFFGRTSNVLPPLKCSPGIIGFARVPHKTIGIFLYLGK